MFIPQIHPNPIGVQKILKSPDFRPQSPDIQMMMIKFPSLDSQNLTRPWWK